MEVKNVIGFDVNVVPSFNMFVLTFYTNKKTSKKNH